jgi:hypothetical protein
MMSLRPTALSLLLSLFCATHAFGTDLPTGTRVFLVTEADIVAKKKDFPVGTTIPVRVWRDVIVNGRVLIEGGTEATMRVDSIKARGIVGRKGKVSFGAVETTAVDGQRINLTGGYGKEGQGRIAMTATIGAILFWPALFIPGGVPKFPEGTVIDSYVDGGYQVAAEEGRPVIDLSGAAGSTFEVEIDYDALAAQEKPKAFDLLIAHDQPISNEVAVVSVNDSSIEPIPVELVAGSGGVSRGTVSIKQLSKHFQKGINRFEVSDGDSGRAEVLVEIQF